MVFADASGLRNLYQIVRCHNASFGVGVGTQASSPFFFSGCSVPHFQREAARHTRQPWSAALSDGGRKGRPHSDSRQMFAARLRRFCQDAANCRRKLIAEFFDEKVESPAPAPHSYSRWQSCAACPAHCCATRSIQRTQTCVWVLGVLLALSVSVREVAVVTDGRYGLGSDEHLTPRSMRMPEAPVASVCAPAAAGGAECCDHCAAKPNVQTANVATVVKSILRGLRSLASNDDRVRTPEHAAILQPRPGGSWRTHLASQPISGPIHAQVTLLQAYDLFKNAPKAKRLAGTAHPHCASAWRMQAHGLAHASAWAGAGLRASASSAARRPSAARVGPGSPWDRLIRHSRCPGHWMRPIAIAGISCLRRAWRQGVARVVL
jgi:hypothetical protein